MACWESDYPVCRAWRAICSLWWVLAQGAPDSWYIGIPTVLLATLSSLALLPVPPVSLFELVRSVPFFLLRSVLGTLDVARRTVYPTAPITPALIDYPMHLPPGRPQVVIINAISLRLGTLTADLSENCTRLHVLDERVSYLAEIEAVEPYVARIFTIP
ncbi:MAG: Na+/H+ antiporter subunit E [Gammaproteobacteria bacterium]